MLDRPFLSMLFLFPFSLVFVFAVIDIIINIFLPFFFALWLAGWAYSKIVGGTKRFSLYEPFWFIRSQKI